MKRYLSGFILLLILLLVVGMLYLNAMVRYKIFGGLF